MAVLVTRPHPDNQRTAHALTLRGIEALLAPMLQFEALPLPDLSGDYAALIVTSANALRAIEQAPALARLQALPVYTVGDHGAQVARAAGFSHVFSAAGDARALAGLVGEQMAGTTKPLLYPSAEDISFDLAGSLKGQGIAVAQFAAYRMAARPALAREVCEALSQGHVSAILHYSQRSADVFFDVLQRCGDARTIGMAMSDAVLHACLSEPIAGVARQAGARRVAVAAHPDETSLLALLPTA